MPSELSRLTLSDFDYPLPPELIAQHPLPDRAASRLLHVDGGTLHDRRFADIESLIAPGDILVFNNTRVIKARLFGTKPTGGRVEVLVERVLAPRRALALVRTSHAPRDGQAFVFRDGRQEITAVVRGRESGFLELEFDADLLDTLEAIGHVPLPPYITHTDSDQDAARYQTVYAAVPGAVAAPTAGLHFTPELIGRLQARGAVIVHVTLHVGAGTFQPVRVERIADHAMHREWYSVAPAAAETINAARSRGARVTAVGTTSLRALESAAREGRDGRIEAGERDTALFITPGFRFQIVDRLVTNFHLPKSTLLMLVSAFAGFERIRAAYAHAIAQRYRFFSYGDAMLLERAT
jgi:S-adenosylmethionine:tRNA ribosyltransferase-isomerase